MDKPVYYMQTDAKWKNKVYSGSTIGRAGCGPTSMAMIIATWVSPNFTPDTACNWSTKHGYACPGYGTYYSYFKPQAAQHGISGRQLNSASIYGKPSSLYHDVVKTELRNGNLVIACMGKGNWTSSGHFVVVYGWDDKYVYINDPASTKTSRIKGNIQTFTSQVKYYFVFDKPKSKEETPMTAAERQEYDEKIKKLEGRIYSLEHPMIYNYIDENMPEWSKEAVRFFCQNGILAGTGEGLNLSDTKLWMLTILYRTVKFICKLVNIRI